MDMVRLLAQRNGLTALDVGMLVGEKRHERTEAARQRRDAQGSGGGGEREQDRAPVGNPIRASSHLREGPRPVACRVWNHGLAEHQREVQRNRPCEDVCQGRRGRALHAANGALAKQAWIDIPDLDAWIIYNIWQVANPELADLVPVGKDYVIYRSSGAALTKKGKESPIPARFVAFLRSKEGAAIFRKWGWMAQ